MSDIRYYINLSGISTCDVFLDASREELRVLLVLIEHGGSICEQELIRLANVTEARAKAAIVLFRECGVLTDENKITEEFEYRLRTGVLEERASSEVARTIRDEGLATLLSECAALMGKPTLNDLEIKKITELYSEYALAEEYIVTLLADMRTRSKCGIQRLVDEAVKLVGRDIDTVEKLSDYFKARDLTTEGERILRRIMGRWNHALTPSEKSYAKKWFSEYGFGEAIVTKAYEIAVNNTTKPNVKYMDKPLSEWYGAGLKTLAECEAYYAANKHIPEKKSSAEKKEKPKYGNFDPDEAFRLALERSFGDDTADKGDESDV